MSDKFARLTKSSQRNSRSLHRRRMKLNRERQRRDADGADYFIGRTDRMFNCGDENFYLADAEVIRLSHPNIARACAVPVPDEIKGYKRVAVTAEKRALSLTRLLSNEMYWKMVSRANIKGALWY